MKRDYAVGESVRLKLVECGSYFWCWERLHLKTSTTQGNGTICLCHPVTGGEYGEIVQVKVNTWLENTVEVNLAIVKWQ